MKSFLDRNFCSTGGTNDNVGLADSLAQFREVIDAGTKLKDLMAQSNHPNRKGHELVVAELVKWFP